MQQSTCKASPETAISAIFQCGYKCGILLLAGLLLAGCGTLPPQADRKPDYAFNDSEATVLGERATAAARQHVGQSGFQILDTGAQAFLQRAALIEAAEHSIDAQYYIWNSDVSGRYLARRLLLAADRGVRVRLLLDDFNVAGRDDVIAALDSHPNIEIRIYNPFATRAGIGRIVEAIGEFQRINRRMHNKTFVIDAAVGIVGGRNIGDEYFGLHPEVNFRDRDMLTVGPIVRDISSNFDLYWNSAAAYPVAVLTKSKLQGEQLDAALAQARAAAADTRELHYTPVQQADAAQVEISHWLEQLEWASAELVFSGPVADKLTDGNTPAPTAQRLGELMRASEREILSESAYFILGQQQLDGIRQLTERGVTLKALTNSLASNDLVGNHAGYARTRKGMLASGLELYELRPDAQDCAHWRGLVSACGGAASLHSKTMVFDRSILYVGSFNLNLRSIYLNGETVLIVRSPRLAEQVAQDIERAMQPANSWQVSVDDAGALQWTGNAGVYDHEPETGSWRRFKAALFGLLPIEKYY